MSTTTGGTAARTVPSSGIVTCHVESTSRRKASEFVVGTVDLVDEQHGRRLSQRREDRPREQETLREQLGLDVTAARARGTGTGTGSVIGTGTSAVTVALRVDPEVVVLIEFSSPGGPPRHRGARASTARRWRICRGEVPVVEGLGGVDALVALEPDERHVEGLGEGFGQSCSSSVPGSPSRSSGRCRRIASQATVARESSAR